MQSREPLSASLLAYAAGLVDSDGAIGIRRSGSAHGTAPAYWPRVRVKQVDDRGIAALVELFGGAVRVLPAPKATRRPSFLWEVTHQRAADVCEGLLPYLQIKAQQAAAVIACMSAIDAGRRRQAAARAVIPGEPVLPLVEAARLAGRSSAAGYAAVRAGTVPCTRRGNRLYVPTSFVPEWERRPRRLTRSEETSNRLEALYQWSAALNRGDAAQPSDLGGERDENALSCATPEILAAYLSGVVDADGHIGVGRSTYKVRVSGDAKQVTYMPRLEIKQVTAEALEIGKVVLGGSRFSVAGQRGGQRLQCLTMHSAAAVRACRVLRPYLRIKAAQADVVLAVGAIHAETGRRRFPIPEVVEGEPLVPLAEAARRAGRRYDTAHQSVRLGNIPFVRHGRRIMIPESFIPTWSTRGRSAVRRADLTDRLEVLYRECRTLNTVGATKA